MYIGISPHPAQAGTIWELLLLFLLVELHNSVIQDAGEKPLPHPGGYVWEKNFETTPSFRPGGRGGGRGLSLQFAKLNMNSLYHLICTSEAHKTLPLKSLKPCKPL